MAGGTNVRWQEIDQSLSEVLADKALPAFVCTVMSDGRDVAWITLAGELDIATAPRLAQALREVGLH